MVSPTDPSRMVLGRYRLDALVGRGGAARVHRAHDVCTGREVAVKEIPVDLDMARRAGAEVRAAGRLSHPAIVRMLDFGEDHSACYLVSELVDGVSLARHMDDGSMAADPATLVGVVADVLDGLAHAHERGVTHRDVKPANILVDRAGRGRLTDFGIARIAGEAGVTTTGGLVGTVSYMAPEQARGDETGPAADVYSASLVLYEGLAGRNPLVAPSPAETLRRAAAGAVAPLAASRRDLPDALCRAVDAGLHPDPQRRPDPSWMARALRAQLGALDGAGRPERRLRRRLPGAVATAGAAALAAWALHRLTELEPGALALAAAGAGLAFAAFPWEVSLLAWVGVMAALAPGAPGAVIVIGALGLVALAPLRRRGRLALLPAAAPALAALGLAPLYAALAGTVRGWRWRAWAALCGMGATLGWQVLAGADPAVHGGRLEGTWHRVEGVVSPPEALARLAAPLQTRPAIAISAALLVLAALAMPLIARLRRGLPRALGVASWIAALIAGVGLGGGSLEAAAGAYLPAGILVAAWAASPWRRLRRRADRRATVRLRGATVERLPAA